MLDLIRLEDIRKRERRNDDGFILPASCPSSARHVYGCLLGLPVGHGGVNAHDVR